LSIHSVATGGSSIDTDSDQAVGTLVNNTELACDSDSNFKR